MKHTHKLLLVIACAVFAASCHHRPPTTCAPGEGHNYTAPGQTKKGYHDDGHGSQFIAADTANLMLSSYLLSVNAAAQDTALHALIVNADSLRAYLNDTCNGKIASVKLMFAHTMSYINSGHLNQYCGYKPGALTIIIAGYDQYGNYIMGPGSTVLDQADPCPALCPINGNAANDIFVTNSKK